MTKKQKQGHFFLSIILIVLLLCITFYFMTPGMYSLENIYSQLPTNNINPHINILPNFISSTADYSNLYRNSTIKKLAWEKLHKGNNATVIVIHARKAGGSTMRGWTGKILGHLKYMHKNDTNFSVQRDSFEFWTYANGKTAAGGNNIDALFKKNPLAIYIIALRNPVERIISQYDFEWRWGCLRCHPGSETKGFMHYNRFPKLDEVTAQDVHKNLFSNIELDELLEKVDQYQNIRQEYFRHRIAFNAYLNNYYLWMLCCDSKYCNIQKDFIEKGKIEQCMKHAMKMIMSFDIVVVDEWLNDIRTRFHVNTLFFGNDITINDTVEIPWTRPAKGPLLNKRGKNLMVDDELYQELIELNKWDLKFYEFVKQLVFERESHSYDQFGTTFDHSDTF